MATPIQIVELSATAVSGAIPLGVDIDPDAKGVTVFSDWWANSSGGPVGMSALGSNFADTFTINQTGTQGGPLYPPGNIIAYARVTSTGSGKTISPTYDWGAIDEGAPLILVFWDGIPTEGDWVRLTGGDPAGSDPRNWTIQTTESDNVAGSIPTQSTDVVLAWDCCNGSSAPGTPAGWTSIADHVVNNRAGRLRRANTPGGSSTSTETQIDNYASLGMIAIMDAGGGADVTVPTLVGTITEVGKTDTTIEISWPAGSDNVGVVNYQVSSNGGSSWVDAGDVLTYEFTGLTAETEYQIRVRAEDAAENVSTPALATAITTEAAPAPPVVAVQPTNQSVDVGDPATFTVDFTDADSVQWKVNKFLEQFVVDTVFVYCGTGQNPGAQAVEVPDDATAVLGVGMFSSTGGTASLTSLATNFTGALTPISLPSTANAGGCTAFQAAVTDTTPGRTITPSYNRAMEVGSGFFLIFLKDINPADIGITPMLAQASAAPTPVSINIPDPAENLVIGVDLHAGTPPSNQSGWTILDQDSWTALVEVGFTVRSLNAPDGGTATMTSQDSNSSIVAGFSINPQGFVNVTDGTGGATESYTTPNTTLDMDGWQYRADGTNTDGTTSSNPATLTVTDPGDVTGPTLSAPTAAATGSTTASAGVTTNEAGPCWAVVTESATPPDASVIEAGAGVGVVAADNATLSVGVNSGVFAFTGLEPETDYWVHYYSEDGVGNPSNVLTSSQFTTNPTADTTDPELSGPIVVDQKTNETISVIWPAGTDNVGVTGYELQVDTGGWDDQGLVLSANILGLTQLTTYDIQVRAYDAAGNRSAPISLEVETYRDGATGQWILDNTGPIGGSPAGILYNDVDEGDEDKWFSFRIITPPANTEDFDIDVYGRFTYTGPEPDSFTYQLEVDGEDVGAPVTVSLYNQIVTVNQNGAWSVRNAVQVAQNGAWRVRNYANALQDGSWSLRGLIQASQDAAWSIRSLISETQSGAWTVRNSVVTVQAGAWSLANFVTATQDGGWSVANLLEVSQAGAWSVRNTIQVVQDGSWSIQETGAVQVVQNGSWSVRNLVSSVQDGASSIRNFVEDNQDASWSVRNYSGDVQNGGWSIQGLEVVAVIQDGSWSVRNFVSVLQEGAWSIAENGVVSVVQDGAWSIRNLIQVVQDASFTVRNLIQVSQDGSWSIEQPGNVVAVQGVSWSVRNYIETNQSAAWSVRNVIQVLQDGAWSLQSIGTVYMVVEDGTGIDNANSYASVEFADTYFTNRLNLTWAELSDQRKASLLIMATDYIDTRWGPYLAGEIAFEDQALLFPRVCMPACAGDAAMPKKLLIATVEYALRANDGPLAPDIESDASGFAIQRRKERVGPIEEEVEFATGQNGSRQLQTVWKVYPAVDMLMQCFIKSRRGRVIRN